MDKWNPFGVLPPNESDDEDDFTGAGGFRRYTPYSFNHLFPSQRSLSVPHTQPHVFESGQSDSTLFVTPKSADVWMTNPSDQVFDDPLPSQLPIDSFSQQLESSIALLEGVDPSMPGWSPFTHPDNFATPLSPSLAGEKLFDSDLFAAGYPSEKVLEGFDFANMKHQPGNADVLKGFFLPFNAIQAAAQNSVTKAVPPNPVPAPLGSAPAPASVPVPASDSISSIDPFVLAAKLGALSGNVSGEDIQLPFYNGSDLLDLSIPPEFGYPAFGLDHNSTKALCESANILGAPQPEFFGSATPFLPSDLKYTASANSIKADKAVNPLKVLPAATPLPSVPITTSFMPLGSVQDLSDPAAFMAALGAAEDMEVIDFAQPGLMEQARLVSDFYFNSNG
ncbi:uncharacterized protein BJ171DRAFT_505510 [Polychytrium aggregatum]|uniref:uncharacterized protein n=1 Tax=Polychytrium aggregatum TaxID=110093 RepID=UPI0022FDB9F1|nr:uncharacterized protein BJ171DRAFT_505510 [Polychytrium aggregatum]KAI9204330.1 hypothetical protein BJ171DRAFT_505510 [Polychytrium aggregatum]